MINKILNKNLCCLCYEPVFLFSDEIRLKMQQQKRAKGRAVYDPNHIHCICNQFRMGIAKSAAYKLQFEIAFLLLRQTYCVLYTGRFPDHIKRAAAFLFAVIFALYYLVMLQRGSMRWTVGSSMYSKDKLPGTLARSTVKLTCTGPAPVTDGPEKQTISELVLLAGAPREGFYSCL